MIGLSETFLIVVNYSQTKKRAIFHPLDNLLKFSSVCIENDVLSMIINDLCYISLLGTPIVSL